MWQWKNISYFNIFKNDVLYLLKFITTPYHDKLKQIKNDVFENVELKYIFLALTKK